MSNAKKLINMAFSDTLPFFSMGRWTGDRDERPKVMTIREAHDLESGATTKSFVINNIKLFKLNKVIADFSETPYWFNSILTGYRDGIVTDKELGAHREAFIASAPPPTEDYRLGYTAQFKKIQHLKQDDIAAVAIDVRRMTIDKLPETLHDTFLRAQELAKEYPESIKYNEFIQSAIEKGLPTDSISASLVSLYLLENKGNGIVTFGAGHMAGMCDPRKSTQGILDDAMTKQGIKVTDVFIVDNGVEFKATQSSYQRFKDERDQLIKEGSKEWKECEPTADHRDFVYLYDNGSLFNKKQARREGGTDPYPSSEYRSAEEVYKPHELNPMLLDDLKQTLQNAGVEIGKNSPLPQKLPQGQGVQFP